MIDASDLTTAEVRPQYVLPLIHEILEKSSLIDHATVLGIDCIRCDVTSTLPGIDAPSTSMDTRGVSTLFQEIATEYPFNHPDHKETGGAVGKDENDATSGSATTRCYAEVRVIKITLFSYFKLWSSLTHNYNTISPYCCTAA